MCDLYRVRSNASEIANLCGAEHAGGNIPDLPEIYPDQDAIIARRPGDGPVIELSLGAFHHQRLAAACCERSEPLQQLVAVRPETPGLPLRRRRDRLL
jgi:hypothetical protein|tara:strand:+ start:3579 stop:3872 length:294 start_codon:yes stop_codon:yes gene_type:complete